VFLAVRVLFVYLITSVRRAKLRYGYNGERGRADAEIAIAVETAAAAASTDTSEHKVCHLLRAVSVTMSNQGNFKTA